MRLKKKNFHKQMDNFLLICFNNDLKSHLDVIPSNHSTSYTVKDENGRKNMKNNHLNLIVVGN